jgi:hypothetical protein
MLRWFQRIIISEKKVKPVREPVKVPVPLSLEHSDKENSTEFC